MFNSNLPVFRLPCILAIGLFFSILIPTAWASEPEIKVLHGDTLQRGDLRIHLQGLASPPRGEICSDAMGQKHPCGDTAAKWLESLIGNNPVRCIGTEFNHAGHLRAMCYVGTKNLNGTMVRAGWALSEGRYGRWHESLEQKAKAAGAGLWADGTGEPWQWNW